MAEKVTPKVTVGDLESDGIDPESLRAGAEFTVDSLYPRRFKSGKLGWGGKLRGSDGTLYQIVAAVKIVK